MIVRYLLGDLPEDLRRRFEEGYLTDDEVFSELLRVEADLIDRYLDGRLTQSQRLNFDNYFLQSEARRRRVKVVGERRKAEVRSGDPVDFVDLKMDRVARPPRGSWMRRLLRRLGVCSGLVIGGSIFAAGLSMLII